MGSSCKSLLGLNMANYIRADPFKALGMFGTVDTKNPVKRAYLEGHGGLVRRLIVGISRVTIRFIGVLNVLTKSP